VKDGFRLIQEGIFIAIFIPRVRDLSPSPLLKARGYSNRKFAIDFKARYDWDTMNKPSVYIETSVISYYCSKQSQDIIIAGHQQITKDWWLKSLPNLTPFVSDIVIEEISQGNPLQAKQRMESIATFGKLNLSTDIEKLATHYFSKLSIPQKAIADVFHLALAVHHQVDFLVSWNCSHIANAHIVRKVMAINHSLQLCTPVICTPEELREEE